MGFAECGMVQCIHSPTHNKGSILDILLTKSEDHVCNLKVLHDKAYCYSDHYPITFDIKTRCCRRNLPKRKIYNFNRADWFSIKSDVDWAIAMDSTEPDMSWMHFKIILNNIINKFVPLVNIKKEFKSPWFDSECYRKGNFVKGRRTVDARLTHD